MNLGIDLGFVHYIEQKKQFTILNSIEKESPTSIKSLNELVSALSEEERTQYDDIIRTMKLPSSVYKNICTWSNESYTRNCIFENEKFELILLCWESGQFTPIHDHGGEECWVKIIEGEFKETIYKIDSKGQMVNVKSIISTTNDVTYMVDFMGFHRLENLSNKRSLSLHLYAKPIRSCKVFDEDTREFSNKKMIYDTVSSFETCTK